MGSPWKPETRHRRMLEQVKAGENGCWLWAGYTSRSKRSSGYALFGKHYVHRWMYEWYKGPIPDGLEVDHLCRVRHCVNPDHLEAVTRRENLLRGKTFAARNAAKTHCPQGHKYDTFLTDKRGREYRRCSICHAAQQRAHRRRKEAQSED